MITTETARPCVYTLGDLLEWLDGRYNMTLDDLAERLRPVANAPYASLEDQDAAMRIAAKRLHEEWEADNQAVLNGTACANCFGRFEVGDDMVPEDYNGHPAFSCARHAPLSDDCPPPSSPEPGWKTQGLG